MFSMFSNLPSSVLLLGTSIWPLPEASVTDDNSLGAEGPVVTDGLLFKLFTTLIELFAFLQLHHVFDFTFT